MRAMLSDQTDRDQIATALDETLIGPSSAAWRRRPGDHGRVAYVTIDGGTTASPDGIVRKAALLRLELQPKVS